MRRRKEVLLELTPLLDVILIMLFYILMQSTQAADARQEQADLEVGAMKEQMEAVIESAEAVSASAESREEELADALTYATELLGSYEVFDTYAQILTVYVSNGQDGMRIIHVSDGKTDETISYGWDDLRYARNSLKDLLTGKFAKGQEDCPIFLVFHYQDDVIYRQDYQLVTEVLAEAAKGQSHVYMRLISEEKEE